MLIFPAIDLFQGKCVRLTRGDFSTAKVYTDDPVEVLNNFKSSGFSWAHLVDLDGAKQGQLSQKQLIIDLISIGGIKCQVGGGVRTESEIKYLLDHGVERVVLGSICIFERQLVKQYLQTFGADKIVLALDCALDSVGVYKVKTHGWQQNSDFSIVDMLKFYSQAQYVLCTDIGVDGTMVGPSIDLYRDLITKFPRLQLIASGGVGTVQDLNQLKKLGVYAVIVGKAIYEGKIALDDIVDFT